MEDVRYFYSTDGSDAHGPVTEAELNQLFQDHVLDTTSYLCMEGETTWFQLEVTPIEEPTSEPSSAPSWVPQSRNRPIPQSFAKRGIDPVPTSQAPPPPARSATSPSRKSRSRRNHKLNKETNQVVLNVICWIVTIGAGIGCTLLVPAKNDASPAYYLCAFFGSSLIIVSIPYLVSRWFSRPYRLISRIVGILLLLGLAVLVKFTLFETASPFLASAPADSPQPGQIEIAQPATPRAATDPALSASIQEDVRQIGQDFIAKVKISNDAIAALPDLDPVTIVKHADIATRRRAVNAALTTHTDIILFLESFDARCRTALAGEKLTPEQLNNLISTLHKNAQIDQIIPFWKMKKTLLNDQLTLFDFLEKNWGYWNIKGSTITFDDDAHMQTYNSMADKIRQDVQQVGELQKQLNP